MDGSKETICASCVHFYVCKHMDEYYAAVAAVRKAEISFTRNGEGNVCMKKVSNIDFIELRDPTCKFYQKSLIASRGDC